jgi:hypothetical protein
LLIGTRGYIAYVGDSRIYLWRGGIVYQLTEDHSLMNELVRRGKIRADEFDDSPYSNFKNAMTRAVGPHEIVEVDTLDFDMIPGDSFLLCTDGLYEYIDDTDITRALALTDVEDIPRQFIDLANTRGGKDNITALVIKLPEDEAAGDRAAEVNFTLDTLKRIPLFKQLSYQQLVRVMNLARMRALEPEQVVCRQGESGDELFVILRGSIRLESGGTVITTLPQGSHFGEMALIDSVPSSVTAVSTEEGKVLTISRSDFSEILRKEPPLAVKLLWSFLGVLAERLRQTTSDLKLARDEAGIEDMSEAVGAEMLEG